MRSFLRTTDSPCLDRFLRFSSAVPTTDLASFRRRFRRRFCLELLVGAGDSLGFDLVLGFLHGAGCGLRRWSGSTCFNYVQYVIRRLMSENSDGLGLDRAGKAAVFLLTGAIGSWIFLCWQMIHTPFLKTFSQKVGFDYNCFCVGRWFIRQFKIHHSFCLDWTVGLERVV